MRSQRESRASYSFFSLSSVCDGLGWSKVIDDDGIQAAAEQTDWNTYRLKNKKFHDDVESSEIDNRLILR